jgi:hypothetical protein
MFTFLVIILRTNTLAGALTKSVAAPRISSADSNINYINYVVDGNRSRSFGTRLRTGLANPWVLEAMEGRRHPGQ